MAPRHRSSNRLDEQTTAEDRVKHPPVAQPELAAAMAALARSSAASPHVPAQRKRTRAARRRRAIEDQDR